MKNSTPLNEVIKALEAKGLKYELSGECSKVDWSDGKAYNSYQTFWGVELGIQTKPGVYVWFSYTEFTDGTPCYFFKQRYNANVGTVIKSYRRGFEERTKLESKLNITL